MKFTKLIKSLVLSGMFIIMLFAFTNNADSWPRFGVVITPAPVEVIPVRPGPRFVWVKGHYKPAFSGWAWIPGHWKRF